MVATVATITSDAEAAIILNGCDFNVSGLFINRLIIFTSGSELLSSDGSGNNCSQVMKLLVKVKVEQNFDKNWKNSIFFYK